MTNLEQLRDAIIDGITRHHQRYGQPPAHIYLGLRQDQLLTTLVELEYSSAPALARLIHPQQFHGTIHVVDDEDHLALTGHDRRDRTPLR
ncbi:hypothetical protein JN531_012505 [Flagellatimonas centrodinii]|uniref:hypothetical protein n=1 Tax=Flagellatimonas centrodinii TaxID=2806210 RepID=UPI001FEE4FAE|nr:hypothetical protein [Flagellatimonas centrodinii]ULQ45920.1 hypothetical protein JN531_012505 [Flagellatimonas centrodinii]